MPDQSLNWRSLTPDDAAVSADLLNAMEVVDQTGEYYDAADTLQELIDPYADLERASLAAVDGGLLVGFMKLTWKPEALDVHRVMMDGGVHPDYRRRGIGAVLVAAGVAAANVLHELHHPTLKLVVDAETTEHVAGTTELFESQGFAPVRYFQDMEHPLGDAIADAGVPDGLRAEPWSPDNDEDFRLIRNESFLDHWGMVSMPADNWKNRMINHTFQPMASFLLRDVADGTPAGMLLTKHWEADAAATGVRDAHFLLIGTLRGYRTRGVASALISHALRAVVGQGFDRASLRVDSASPSGAFGLYEKAGFTATQRQVRWALEA